MKEHMNVLSGLVDSFVSSVVLRHLGISCVILLGVVVTSYLASILVLTPVGSSRGISLLY